MYENVQNVWIFRQLRLIFRTVLFITLTIFRFSLVYLLVYRFSQDVFYHKSEIFSQSSICA